MATLAFLLILGGIILTYGEFIWVGKLIFGVAGALCTLSGIAILSRVPHVATGMWLIAASVLLFLIESRFKTYLLAGISATMLCALGFWRLCPSSGIAAGVAFPASGVFGFVTIWLLAIAKRARRNKAVR